MMPDLGDCAEIDVLVGQAALRGDVGESLAFGDALGVGASVVRIRKDDLLDMSSLWRDVTGAPILVGALEVVVRNLDPAGLLARDQRHHDQLAEFRRAEEDLALLEILGELFRSSGRDLAGLAAIEQHIIDRALLVLIAVYGLDRGLGRDRAAQDGARELAPHHLRRCSATKRCSV